MRNAKLCLHCEQCDNKFVFTNFLQYVEVSQNQAFRMLTSPLWLTLNFQIFPLLAEMPERFTYMPVLNPKVVRQHKILSNTFLQKPTIYLKDKNEWNQTWIIFLNFWSFVAARSSNYCTKKCHQLASPCKFLFCQMLVLHYLDFS